MNRTLRERVMDEADLCRNDGADDIARLLDEVAAAQAEQDRRLQLAMQNYERWKAHAIELSARLQQYEPGAGMALNAAPQPAAQPVPFDASAECSPMLTQCPRCKNPHHACDGGNKPAAQPVAVPETLRLDRALAFVPDGYALVPVEPTREMRKAATIEQEHHRRMSLSLFGDEPAAVIYRAMLSAAPKLQQ